MRRAIRLSIALCVILVAHTACWAQATASDDPPLPPDFSKREDTPIAVTSDETASAAPTDDEAIEPPVGDAIFVSDERSASHSADSANKPGQASRGVQDSYYARRAAASQKVATRPIVPAVPSASPGDLFPGVQRAAMHGEVTEEYHGAAMHDGYYGEQIVNGEPYVDGEYFGEGCADGSCYDDDCSSCGRGHGLFGGFCADLWTDAHSNRTFSARVDYLSWWERGSNLPPLLTTSPPGTSQTDAGILGLPSTSVLVGDERVLDNQRNGGRVQLCYWIGGGEWCGIEGDYLLLEDETVTNTFTSIFSGGATTDPILARPFFNTTLNSQDALLVAFPQFFEPNTQQLIDLDGSISIENSSEIQSAGLGLRRLLWIDFDAQWRVYLTGGYRYWEFNDRLAIADQTNPVGGFFAPGSFIATSDQFEVTNEFHGGDVGMAGEIRRGCWSLELMGKLALGNNHQVVQINGQTTSFDGTTAITSSGGLLTQPSNIGTYRRDDFALIPQVAANLSYQINCNLRAHIGYTFTYWFDVLRSADQVDLSVNLDQATNPLQRPAVPFNESDFWLQGINAGVELSF